MRKPAKKSKPATTGDRWQPNPSHSSRRNRRQKTSTLPPDFPAWLLAAFLALVTIAIYWPAAHFDFINFDDPLYVTDNNHVKRG